MALRTTRIPLSLAKCILTRSMFGIANNNIVVQHTTFRAGVPVVQRAYATVPSVAIPAQTPALRKQSVSKKGVLDYVLTSADAVCVLIIPDLNKDCELGSTRVHMADDFWSGLLCC